MDDDYDIYGDLDGFEVEAQKENKIVKELNGEIKQLKEQITQTESEKEAIARKNEVLLENISSLLLTAKAELKRKDALIADIRREKDDVAFRRARGAVKKHDKATQTERVRMVHREAQTDVVPLAAASSGRRHEELRQDKVWARRGSSDSRPHTRERPRSRSRSRDRSRPGREKPRISERLQKRLGWPKDTKLTRERTRERERERERRARRGPHSPEVRFHSPIRVGSKHQEVGVADSASDIDLVKGLIPMNRVELDRYVKEIGRKESRSPEGGCYPAGASSKTNTLLGLRDSDLWDGKQTPMKPKIQRQTPEIEDSTDENSLPADAAPRKQEEIIQSDEIGTTGNGSTLSPEKSEELEQKMLALHGEAPMVSIPVPPAEYQHQTSAELLEGLNSKDSFDTSQPAKFVIPPPEPPIIEQVPEMPLDDDVKLNDSRELRIIESDEMIAVQQRGEDERNSSAETVIERNQAPQPPPSDGAVAADIEEELEEGEVVSATESEVEERDRSKERNKTKATKAENKIRQENKKHRISDRKDKRDVSKKPDESKVSHRRRHHSHSEKPLPHKPDLSHSHKHQHHNVSHPPLDTSTPNRASSTISTRRSSLREKLSGTAATKVESKATEPTTVVRSSERQQKARTRKQSTTWKDLFGSDDENSPAKQRSPTKRKHSPEKEALVKKWKPSEQPLPATAADSISISQQQATLSQREIVKKSKVELPPEMPSVETVVDLTISEVALDKSEPCTEPPPITSTPLATHELQSPSEQVISITTAQEPPKEDPVIKQNVETSPVVSVPDNTANKEETVEESAPCTYSSPEKAATDPSAPATTGLSERNSISPQVITYSNKYSDYRIEVNNEVEATVYITRKKKKKGKSKTATPNTSIVDPV